MDSSDYCSYHFKLIALAPGPLSDPKTQENPGKIKLSPIKDWFSTFLEIIDTIAAIIQL